MLRGLLGEGIELTISLSGGRGTIDADPSQIEQVLMNLTINARDAMPDGGRIVVETANVEVDETNVQQFPRIRPGHYAMLSVSDTGMGMDEETQSRIFEPFFTTKPPGKGAGLGLSIVSGIAKQCGGAIAVHSEPGAGAAFKVYFPRSDEALKTVPPGKREPGRAEAETILLVDDAADLRKLMRRILEDCGYTVLDSGDPAEAIRLAAERSAPLRLMITDVVLPGCSGSDLAERVNEIMPETKVLYVSGYSEDSMIPPLAPGPAQAFLKKPFTRDDFLVKVRQLLGSC
jgi:CheY-like chemotaxis protein